ARLPGKFRELPLRCVPNLRGYVVESHEELASYYHEVLETIEDPALVVRGNRGTLKAARNLGRLKWLIVVYREVSREDGFLITAYLLDTKPKGEVVWRQQ
ncbi:MAG: hypothetical protein CO096_03150, partial [Armatimonadetes bacterium CG_4_9_14_3_um_filter_66_14]